MSGSCSVVEILHVSNSLLRYSLRNTRSDIPMPNLHEPEITADVNLLQGVSSLAAPFV